jgi:hypothetical protein
MFISGKLTMPSFIAGQSMLTVSVQPRTDYRQASAERPIAVTGTGALGGF